MGIPTADKLDQMGDNKPRPPSSPFGGMTSLLGTQRQTPSPDLLSTKRGKQQPTFFSPPWLFWLTNPPDSTTRSEEGS